jgi:hypothetical protein
MSTEYEDALDIARNYIENPDEARHGDKILARQILAQHERMQEILAAINTVVEIRDRLHEDISAVLPDMTGYEEAWKVLRHAVGRKVES